MAKGRAGGINWALQVREPAESGRERELSEEFLNFFFFFFLFESERALLISSFFALA